jgi:spore germination cell wall hydrolase CwlJ-like protein
MNIRRPRPLKGGHTTKARTFVAAMVVALTMTSMSQVNAAYAPIAGVRGSQLTIPLDPPTPLTRGQQMQMPSSILPSAYNPTDPSINAPVPLPDAIMAAMPLSPTPVANPLGPNAPKTPFVMPTRYDTGPSALPYVFSSGSSIDSMRAAMCLTSAIYYEAASESDDGQRAVAQVVLNRVRHPAWPNTVCGVVYQGSDKPGCQFSFACDGSMARRPVAAAWARAARHARAALAGYVHSPVGLATFYHTPAVNPSWNKRLIVSNVIGYHIFYRMPGDAGGLRSFYGRYAGGEPIPAPKARAYTPPSFTPTPRMAQAPTAAYPSAVAPAAAYPTALPPIAAPVPLPNQSVGYAGNQPAVREDNRYVSGSLPESDINPKYRDSGTWIAR